MTFRKLIGWSWIGRWAAASRDRREQRAGRVAAQQRVDVAQVLAEQVVEQGVQGAGVVVAVPPEPVGALGDVDLVPGPRQRGRVVPAGCVPRRPGTARAACSASQPRLSSGWPIQMAKLWLIQLPAKSRGNVSVGGCSRRNSPTVTGRTRGSRAAALVERAEERDAAVGVVFPAVLAVEDHRDERRRVRAGRRRRWRAACRGSRPAATGPGLRW